MNIRKMTEADIPKVQETAESSWREAYEGLIEKDAQDRFLEYAYSSQMLKMRLKRSVFFVAEEEDVVSGFINVTYPNGDRESVLAALYVRPEYQRMGTGEALFRACFDVLEEADVLTLNVEAENEKGTAFYKKHGFVEVERMEETIGEDTFQSILMKKSFLS
ncbi:ribosomal protein S18 acetylase RimI-like enzyme [Sinobaca qinghaiensis]|uniref:Ribosomal protein S18 acetylase RimI-like enzyme n=1 Tax=Sinobaca qinghaiensis TaxID=342944 RepID=A0A419V7F9_9BACL|nr:GNAT family N-acetyltransferase [Sinobaca qinghaiensis]RKD76046.1 ribosomal protein S18 acetylase RimI-like enzyme [Sinobaca qinghaiensis]